MTCVVGMRTETGALVAFDSLSAAGGEITTRRDIKGASLSYEVAFGYTYSYRYGQIISHHLSVPVVTGDEHEWVVRSFVPKMRETLCEHGWLKKDSDREEAGQCILAVRSRIFVIHSDHSVAEPEADYAAVGSGSAYAAGALSATAGSGFGRTERVALALDAAATHNAYVSAPWHFIATTLSVPVPVAA